MCIRDRYINRDKLKKKVAREAFFKDYFNTQVEGFTKRKRNDDNSPLTEGTLSDLIWPFRKNSANKTMNSKFLKFVFSSDKFVKDYNCFLEQFDEETEKDNMSKVQTFAHKVEALIANGKPQDAMNIKRMPWLKIWLENAKTLAHSLLQTFTGAQPSDEIISDEKAGNLSPTIHDASRVNLISITSPSTKLEFEDGEEVVTKKVKIHPTPDDILYQSTSHRSVCSQILLTTLFHQIYIIHMEMERFMHLSTLSLSPLSLRTPYSIYPKEFMFSLSAYILIV
eukprot:TRINITY_DN4040_c0_g1_i1.p1 TRINITY_DN4040_c0_g1~~TRINITY_DN4040_c0_g1_i1.p1  ORF type:complete len:301 (+),score=60.04 TRINITY_DN4040_c0_g1_i1:61-903(+)